MGTSRGTDARIGYSASAFLKGKCAMSTRLSRVATGTLVAAILLVSGRSWAIYYGLGPSKDDWGLKYDVTVNEVDHDTLSVEFTLADEGRMKPIYALELIAFSKETDNQGGHGYDVNAPIELKPTKDGRRAGQVQIRKEFADRAMFRIRTHMVDGQQQPSGGAYYTIPLNKFLNKAPATAPLASPPPSKVTR
jgi:hypothetical protein